PLSINISGNHDMVTKTIIDCKPIQQATANASIDLKIEPSSFIVTRRSWLFLDCAFRHIYNHIKKASTAGMTQIYMDHCQPKPAPSASGKLRADAVVAISPIQVV